MNEKLSEKLSGMDLKALEDPAFIEYQTLSYRFQLYVTKTYPDLAYFLINCGAFGILLDYFTMQAAADEDNSKLDQIEEKLINSIRTGFTAHRDLADGYRKQRKGK